MNNRKFNRISLIIVGAVYVIIANFGGAPEFFAPSGIVLFNLGLFWSTE